MERNTLINDLNWLPENSLINFEFLTKGDMYLTNDQNTKSRLYKSIKKIPCSVIFFVFCFKYLLTYCF